MVTSWHAANIASEDMSGAGIDQNYLERVNKATLADWRLMRTTVRTKYGPAMKDSRFFLLDHMLDYIILGAGLAGRYQVATWLYGTEGARDAETPELLKVRKKLGKTMYLSQSVPFGWFGPAKVVNFMERRRQAVEKRAKWRLENGIELRPSVGIMRPDAPFPMMTRLWRHFEGKKTFSVTPNVVKEPKMMRPNLTGGLPPVFKTVGVISLILYAIGATFDILDTGVRKLKMRFMRQKRKSPSVSYSQAIESGNLGSETT